MKDTVRRGSEAEMFVCAELLKRGYGVSLPIAHNRPYDIIAEDRHGRLKKVQVKRAYLQKTGKKKELSVGVRRCLTTRTKDSKAQAVNYELGDFDILIACDIEGYQFWIIPIYVVLGYKSNVMLETEKMKEGFLGKWGLI